MGDKEEGTQQRPTGEIMAPGSVQHLAEAMLFLNKAGLLKVRREVD